MAKKVNTFQLFLFGVISAFAPLAMDLYLPGLPELQRDLNTSASLAQLTITASLIGIGLGQVVIGPLSDRVGRRKPLLVGILVFTVSSLAIATTNSIGVMIGLRLLQGLGGATGIVLSLAMLTDLFSGRELTKQISINQTINGIFPVLAPVFGGVIVAISDWRVTFVLLAVLGIVLGISIFLTTPETLPTEERRTADLGSDSVIAGFKHLFKEHSFMVYTLTQAFLTASLFAYIAGSTFMLESIFGLSTVAFGGVYAINGLGIAITAGLSGRLALKYGEKTALKVFIYIGLLGSIALLGTTLLEKSIWLVLPPLFLIVATIGGIIAMTTTLAMQDQKARAGSASALLGLFRYTLGGVMSPLVGLFGNATYLPLAIIILTLQLLGLIIFTQVKSS